VSIGGPWKGVKGPSQLTKNDCMKALPHRVDWVVRTITPKEVEQHAEYRV